MVPPPTQIGERDEPARARPVPFWRHGLAPPPRTSPRVLVDDVPWRRAASSARTDSCTSGPLKRAPKATSSRTTSLPPPRCLALGIGADLHEAVLGAGDRTADEQEVVRRVDAHDLEALLGDALVAHLAGAADALHHAGGPGGRADRSGGAHVVRAVGLRAALEVVALDGALEALALAGAGDLDRLADLEGLDRDGVADLQLAGLVAELHEVAHGRSAGLLEVAELGLAQVLLLRRAERELEGLVAVAVMRADARDRARAGLEHGDALDAAVVEEDLGHPELLGEDGGHYARSLISMFTPAGRWSRRWSESTVLGVGPWMSIRRLCVRISKCSCESLSLNGDFMPAWMLRSVGSGTGPETVAPVRVAVSTISLAAVSRAWW